MNKMYRTIKNLLKGRKKVKDEFCTAHVYREIHDHHYASGIPFSYHAYCHDYSYENSLSQFLRILRSRKKSRDLVVFRETLGWKPHVKFSWDEPQYFSPEEAADYIERRKLLTDHWNHFESRWQVFSDRGGEQHYFDIDIYQTTFPMGSLEMGKLKHKITLECLLAKE